MGNRPFCDNHQFHGHATADCFLNNKSSTNEKNNSSSNRRNNSQNSSNRNNVRVLQEAPRKTMAIILPVDVYATRLEALVDTGAVRNFINPSAISKERHATIESDNKEVVLANGTEVEIKGKVRIEFEISPDKKTRYTGTFYLLEDCHPSLILGMEFLSANELLLTWRTI